MSKTRNRRKAPPPTPLNLEMLPQWQASATNLAWATAEPLFRRAIGVATNERINAFNYVPTPPGIPLSEEARYGIFMGYEACLRVLATMASSSAPPQGDDAVTFPDAPADLHEDATTT